MFKNTTANLETMKFEIKDMLIDLNYNYHSIEDVELKSEYERIIDLLSKV